ncbi:MAG: transcriptional repressor [Armatimonadetes bacterium]|nr:transcriptional repressor [Armatimonadota bacterium]
MNVQQYEQNGVETLRAKGLRITMPRIQVLRILGETDRPLTAHAIHQKIMAKGDRIDLVSVYRILATLAELHLVHHIGVVDGYVACTMEESHTSEAEHFVCTDCGKVREIAMPVEALEATTKHLASLGLTPSLVKFEILGKCNACTA